MTARFIDIHVLQSVPPSCVNRDDTGSPKTAIYGGVRRARVSSQAWKRATRAAFEQHLDRSDIGVRTNQAVAIVVDEMHRISPETERDDAVKAATQVLDAVGIKTTPPKGKKGAESEEKLAESKYLVFFSRGQITKLAELALEDGKPNKKDAVAAANQSNGVEVALFGRMVADNTQLNVDAAVQVAHAISTHEAEVEGDYFTAVDDLRGVDEQGADMIGVVDFTSATLYRYATINLAGLETNLGDRAATVRAAQAFIEAFVLSMPTGKQNTFANRTLPEAVVIEVREDQPVNAVGAFEDPIKGTGSGLVRASAQALAGRLGRSSAFLREPLARFSVVGSDAAAELAVGEQGTLHETVAKIGELLGTSEQA